MSVETAPSFACESCNREFRWKPAIAGKSAKCSCGATVQVPATEPGKAPPSTEDDDNNIFGQLEAVVAAAPVTIPPPIPGQELDVAPVKVSPSRKTAAALAGGSKTAAKAGPAKIGGAAKKSSDPRFHQRTSVGLTKEELDDMRNMSFWGHPKERAVPFIMLGVSMAVFYGVVGFKGEIDGEGFLFWSIYSVLCAVGLTGAAFVTAGVAGMSFGIMGIGILRLMAISYACLAVNVVCYQIPYSGFVNSALTYAIFTFGLMGFFGLEYAETRIVAFVSVVLKFLLLILALIIGDKIGSGHSSSDDDDFMDDDDVPAHVSKDKKAMTGDKATNKADADDDEDEKDAK